MTTSLLEALRAGPKRNYPCRVADVLTKVTDEERSFLITALESDSGWSALRLVGILREDRIEIGASAIIKHRQGRCSCE